MTSKNSPAADPPQDDADPRERRIRKLEAILDVAKAMAAQRDLDSLLDLIARQARDVVGAERSSIFLLDKEKNELWSKVAQGSAPLRFPADRGIAGRAAQVKAPLNITDAYADPRFNPDVDRATGFKTRELLAVPMLSTRQEVVGVLQVLNKRPSGTKLPPRFDPEDEEMLLALGGQAAAAIENALLHEEINRLFEGFIAASVVAIESRDPTTSGHSERVAALTCRFAGAVDRLDRGPFADISFDRDQMRELRYASLLHDFGKVGVRENVLVKAEKLYPGELALLMARFDFIRRTLEKEALERKLAAAGGDPAADGAGLAAEIDRELAERLEELEELRRFLVSCNAPSVLERGGFERLREIAARTYASFDGPKPFLAPQELQSLSIPKGSLTERDRLEIESHVTHTYRFLSAIPWTKALQRVPEIAYGHHEKLDGRGYPRSVAGAEIPIQTRMMTISDIYDALTASDRPYKRAVPASRALDILGMDAKESKIDEGLLRVFIEAKIYEQEPPTQRGTPHAP